MKNVIPIEDLIKQLQEIAVNNPGIKVVQSDRDYGLSMLVIARDRVFYDTVPGRLVQVNLEDYQKTLDAIKHFESKSASTTWKELSEADQIEYYSGKFSYFEKHHNRALKYHNEDKVKYENAETYLIISGG